MVSQNKGVGVCPFIPSLGSNGELIITQVLPYVSRMAGPIRAVVGFQMDLAK